jgi:hypothetical protein
MKKYTMRAYYCFVFPFVWLYCLGQYCLGMPQDMSLVNNELRDAWRHAGD